MIQELRRFLGRLPTALLFMAAGAVVTGCTGGVSTSNYDRLRVGMTAREVDGLLGKGKEVSADEVAQLLREAMTPTGGPDGKNIPNLPKVEVPDRSNTHGVRWGDDKKSITVVYLGDRVHRMFKKGF